MTGSRYRQGFPAAIRRGLDYTNKLNDAQLQLAERSYELRDLVSVGTLMSLTGLALVIHGAQRIDTLSGVNEVAAGRGFDLADGFLARAFDQESDLGAAADAVSDKVGMGCIIVSAWRRGAVPKWALSTVLASNVINAGLTGIAVARHPHASYRPPAEGKHAMTLYNAGVLGFAYANALENEHPDRHFHEPLRILAASAIAAGSAIALPAAATYARRAAAPLEAR